MPRLETLRAKVGAGILDVYRPGWVDEIDVKRLDLSHCGACVLGQLYGDYHKGAKKLFAMASNLEEACVEGGFQAARPGATDSILVSYRNLTAAWRREIARRQKAA